MTAATDFPDTIAEKMSSGSSVFLHFFFGGSPMVYGRVRFCEVCACRAARLWGHNPVHRDLWTRSFLCRIRDLWTHTFLCRVRNLWTHTFLCRVRNRWIYL